jgi:hypothetical protein
MVIRKKIDAMIEGFYRGLSTAIVNFVTSDCEKIQVKPGFKKIPTL